MRINLLYFYSIWSSVLISTGSAGPVYMVLAAGRLAQYWYCRIKWVHSDLLGHGWFVWEDCVTEGCQFGRQLEFHVSVILLSQSSQVGSLSHCITWTGNCDILLQQECASTQLIVSPFLVQWNKSQSRLGIFYIHYPSF